VADECALKLAILKMKVTQHDVGSFGKRKVARRCFASSSSERGWASDGGARRDGTRSSGCGTAGWRKETTAFGMSGSALGL
jgi:hypothetical protein